MPKVFILKGLPGSGKSTWAKEYITKHPETKRVNKDDLRAMLDNGVHSKNKEKFILSIRDFIILSAALNGNDIIVDDTNFNPVHEKQIRELFDGLLPETAEFEVKFFDTDVRTCIERDSKRPNPVGEKVIRGMRRQWKEQFPTFRSSAKLAQSKMLPKAIICDLDGTLAIIGDRSPYDAEKCAVDDLNQPIFEIIDRFYDAGWKILLFSGRDGSYAKNTQEWLHKHNVAHDLLVMRTPGDKRKDAIVKKEFFEQYAKDKYNVMFVLDDRNQVVDMWREMGLTCLQVEYGDF